MYILAIKVTQMIGALSIALLANTYLTLVCLYLPKLYAIRFADKTCEPFAKQRITMQQMHISNTSPVPSERQKPDLRKQDGEAEKK